MGSLGWARRLRTRSCRPWVWSTTTSKVAMSARKPSPRDRFSPRPDLRCRTKRHPHARALSVCTGVTLKVLSVHTLVALLGISGTNRILLFRGVFNTYS